MAYTTVNKSTLHFDTKLYTGNGSSQTITGLGFQPDINWTRKRTSENNHAKVDVVRGVTKTIYPDLTSAEELNLWFNCIYFRRLFIWL